MARNILTLALFLITLSGYSQIYQDSLVVVKRDTTLCKERGHVQGSVVTVTAMYCPPYTIDYTDSTVVVYPSCNYVEFNCMRCGRYVSEKEKEKETKVTLWRRERK